jgi:hypothetical protein
MISEDIPSESNAVLIYAPSVAFFVVTPIFILFRFWSRVARRSGLGWDDTAIIISFVSYAWTSTHQKTETSETVICLDCTNCYGSLLQLRIWPPYRNLDHR